MVHGTLLFFGGCVLFLELDSFPLGVVDPVQLTTTVLGTIHTVGVHLYVALRASKPCFQWLSPPPPYQEHRMERNPV